MTKIIKLVIVVAFSVFVSRALFLTVLMHGYYADLAKGNQIRTDEVPAPRGVIVDTAGRILAGNIEVNKQIVRNYPEGEITADIVGYLNRDGVGVAGLEKQYQNSLAGKPGVNVVEETASGKTTSEVNREEPVAGSELKLNIDLPLQREAYQELKNKLAETGVSGSVIVAKVSGEVLALVSLPSYDPNLFITNGKRGSAGGIYTDAAEVVNDDDKKPLFNRVISGGFAPGSVYKLVTSTAGLSDKIISKDDLISDSGEIVIGSYRYGNWLFDKTGRTEGEINVEKALARSNDVFFYKLGEKIGVDRLVAWSEKLGLGKKAGIDLPSESAGLMPSPLWMEKEKGTPWFLGNTYHLAIGQGDLLATPLQINRMTAGVVSGKYCSPSLKAGGGNCRDLAIDKMARQTVLSGMRQACENGGTAFPFYDLKGLVICKTGTAQHGSETDKPHAWLTAVVPSSLGKQLPDWQNYENGIVVTVMVEDGGEGSEVAAPVARKIVDYILAKMNG